MKFNRNQDGTILLAGALFTMFALIYIGVASSMTKAKREAISNETEAIYLNTTHLSTALERYYFTECFIGDVDIDDLVGIYIDANYVTSDFQNFSLAISDDSGSITTNVTFTFTGVSDEDLSQKTLMAGASISGNELSMTKAVIGKRNGFGEYNLPLCGAEPY